MRTVNSLFIVFLLVILAGCKTSKTTSSTTAITSEVTTTQQVEVKTIVVNNSTEFTQALKSAIPGHTIILKSGEYVGNKGTSGDSRAYFRAFVDGIEGYPITIQSEDSSNPAIIKGTDVTSGYALYITGDYYVIKNVKVENAQKGIMLDHSNDSIIDGCEVYNIGHEAIHLRDGSSRNIIQNSHVHDTGKFYEGYGEGIYVGSDKGKWGDFDRNANDNVIKNNQLGPNVAAEHIDIKEGTVGTIIENNTFDGTGITGVHYADSFIDAKGNKAIIRNNIMNQNDNPLIVDAIQVSTQISGWGFLNEVYDNTISIDANAYIVNVFSGSAKAKNNSRDPEGNMYKGNVTIME